MANTLAEIEDLQREFRIKADKTKEDGDELSYVLLKYLESSLEIDKCFRCSDELMAAYKSVIKDKMIEVVNGMKWPINILIAETPNSEA